MDSIDFGYSMGNIRTYSKSSYLYNLIDKVEKTLKCMRCKALFFDRDQANSNTNVNNNAQYQHINTFNLKTGKFSPQIQDMKKFEKDMQIRIHDRIHQNLDLHKINFRKSWEKILNWSINQKMFFFQQIRHKIFMKSRRKNMKN